jgi:hypothetical protein
MESAEATMTETTARGDFDVSVDMTADEANALHELLDHVDTVLAPDDAAARVPDHMKARAMLERLKRLRSKG